MDHPVDPENKYLYHDTVISNEQMTMYKGMAVLDRHGEARVVLPDYVEALNTDFNYQLTCVGGYSPCMSPRNWRTIRSSSPAALRPESLLAIERSAERCRSCLQ